MKISISLLLLEHNHWILRQNNRIIVTINLRKNLTLPVCLRSDLAALISLSSINSITICSYKSISLLSDSLSGCIVCKTVSQCPLLISLTKLSIDSTVFKETEVSSLKI